VLVVAAAIFAAPMMPAHAALVGTAEVLAPQPAADRARLATLLEREDLQRRLAALGVDVDAARDRVAHLTDAEAARLNRTIDQAPAGGDALGVVVAIVVILVITDLVGWTDIFPFIGPVR
jgi:hypothetical protein